MLGSDFRPLNDPDAEPRPPRRLGLYQAFLYGCGRAAEIIEAGDEKSIPHHLRPGNVQRDER